jgi:methyl-accepting chemotaxis protein
MTKSQVVPTAREFRSSIIALECMVSLPTAGVMLASIHVLTGLAWREWVPFGVALMLSCGALVAATEPMRRRILAPIRRYLDGAAEQSIGPREIRQAFEAVIRIPFVLQRLMLVTWLAGGIVVCVCMSLLGYAGWGFGFRSLAVLVACSTGAVISAIALLFLVKTKLAPIRESLASEIADPEERRTLIHRVSLARKVQYVMASSVFASLIFSMTIAYWKVGGGVDEMAVAWQQRSLDALASSLEEELEEEQQRSFEVVLADHFPDLGLLPFGASFDVVGIGAGEGDDGQTEPYPRGRDRREASLDSLAAKVLGYAAEGQEKEGVRSDISESEIVAWRVLRDGRVLFASVPRGPLHESFGGLGLLLGLMLVIATGLAICVAHLLASDVGRAIEVLNAEAQRMASGDLRRHRVFEAEDELGDLARSFERVGGALRATVGRVAEAADRVDGAAAEISSLSENVAAASANQMRGIQEANDLTAQIKQQVGGIADSAQALNASVEESSSSILELGAAGDELNDTASVLSEKVDAVSSSIEQMVRSVKQVGASSDELRDAAAETSSSMEEMASAMRAVDTTAEMTAKLSREVVDSAESGQGKVSQTIEGMQAISEATDTAEHVIRGLGARTKEIGAILDVIDDVADETNLLALNAAIIAAQAGEHGRAFSVVADEIKELADRVLVSTKEIGGLIRSVQGEANNAIGAIEEGSRMVASGVERSADAGISLEEITRSSRESGRYIAEIVSAVREQTKAASHVVGLMDRVRDGVDQIVAAGSEQDRGNEVVYRSSVTMSEVAQQVRRTTEEQSRGFGRIRESVEGVREAVEQINDSLQGQSAACAQVAEFLEQVFDQTRGNEASAQRMGDAMRGLLSQAEVLREDVAKFQI